MKQKYQISSTNKINQQMHRRELQIETNFLGDEALDQPHSYIQDQNEESAVFLEKVLSCILAREFIDCWEGLKEFYYLSKKNQRRSSHHLNIKQENYQTTQSKYQFKSKSRAENSYSQHRSASVYSKRERVNTHQIENYQVGERSEKRMKSQMSVGGELKNERANVLEEIVEKLKESHRKPDITKQVSLEMYKKISNLERMMQDIKRENKTEGSRVRRRNMAMVEDDNEEDEVMRTFVKEIKDIRHEIADIKRNNDELIRLQLENIDEKSTNHRENHQEDKMYDQHQKIQNNHQKIPQSQNPPKNYDVMNGNGFGRSYEPPIFNHNVRLNQNQFSHPIPPHIQRPIHNNQQEFTHLPFNNQGSTTLDYQNYNGGKAPSPIHTINLNYNKSSELRPQSTHRQFSHLERQQSRQGEGFNMQVRPQQLIKFQSNAGLSTNMSFPSATSTFNFNPNLERNTKHFRNPSIERQHQFQPPPQPWQLPTYCGSCGRSCNCRKAFRPSGPFF